MARLLPRNMPFGNGEDKTKKVVLTDSGKAEIHDITPPDGPGQTDSEGHIWQFYYDNIGIFHERKTDEIQLASTDIDSIEIQTTRQMDTFLRNTIVDAFSTPGQEESLLLKIAIAILVVQIIMGLLIMAVVALS